MSKIAFYISLSACLFHSCDAIIEDDLSNRTVSVLSPADDITVSNSQVQFIWEYLDEAIEYRIQVCRPSFEAMEWMLYDTTVVTNSLTLTLNPGSYQWRIRAENGSSVGTYTTRSIAIDSTMDLNNQQIILISPIDGLNTNEPDIDFSWFEIYNAEQYSFKLYSGSWGGTLALPEQVVDATQINVVALMDGQYSWGVRGESNLTNTPYTVRNFLIDTESPIISEQQSPPINAIVTSPVLFQWDRTEDSGSQIIDSIFVYSDITMQNLIWQDRVLQDTVSLSFSPGIYYWRLRTYDLAGNASEIVSPITFSVQ